MKMKAKTLVLGLLIGATMIGCGGADSPGHASDGASRGSSGQDGSAASAGRAGSGDTNGSTGMGGSPGGGGAAGAGQMTDAAGAVIVKDGGVVPSDSAMVAASAGVPAPWKTEDIGDAAKGKSVILAGPAAITLQAGGTEIGGVADSFQFIYTPLTGDGEVQVRIGSLDNVVEATAGIMLRASLMPNAPNAYIAVLGDKAAGGRFQFRKTAGGATEALDLDAATKIGVFLRLTREGKTVTAYRSTTTRQTWAKLGSVDIDLPAQVLVGVATQAKSATTVVNAQYNYLLANNLRGNPATAAWEQVDFGTMAGVVMRDGNSINVSGWGEVLSANQDFATYLLQNVTGPYTITAKISSVGTTDSLLSRAGLMFRESTPSTVGRTNAHAMISVTSGSGVLFQSRSPGGGQAVENMTKNMVKAPVWLRLEKSDKGALSKFVGSYSLNGTSWTVVDTAMFSVSEPIMVGVIVNGSSLTTLSTAKIEELNLTTPGPAGPVDAGAPDAAAKPGKL